MYRRILTAILLLLFGGRAWAADAKTVFKALEFSTGDQKLPYRMMSPKGYDTKADTKYPLVIFLHGAGERGTDNTIQLVHGMNDFAKDENREKYPAFVVAPQCPEGKRWVEVDWTLPKHTLLPEPSVTLQLVFDLIEDLRRRHRIDDRRIYITGLSMGGFGVWDALVRKPDLFAAAAPVCGGADEATAPKIAKIPIWTFHGAKDTVVIPDRSRNMVAALKAAGGRPKYTEYPEVAHDSWNKAYSDPELLAWLFAQKKED